MSDNHRIVNVTLDERTVRARSPEVEHERQVAIFDLLEENSFEMVDGPPGPYNLHLSIQDNRLVLDVRDGNDGPLGMVSLAVTPLRSLVRDYFTICDSYYNAIRTQTPQQIEAIDMGRRAIHNEGADMLGDLLNNRIRIDTDTSRRLFTLVCVLHIRGDVHRGER